MTSPSGRPGISMVLSSAEVNGLLRPSPSSATLPGWVENAISVPTLVSTCARPRLDRAGARAEPARQVRRQRIVAAGVEENDVGPRVGLHAAQHQIEIDGAEIEIGLGLDLGVDRHEIVLAGDLQSVAGVEQQRHVGVRQLFAEAPHRRAHALIIEVEPADHLEAQSLQRRRHVGGVVGRVLQLRRVLVGGVADHQRHALVGQGGCRHEPRDHPEAGSQRGQAQRGYFMSESPRVPQKATG